jgi:hypothetical protein
MSENNGTRFNAAVAQASGMVSVQASCTCAEAVVLMTERAAETHHTLSEVAAGVLQRSVRFDV